MTEEHEIPAVRADNLSKTFRDFWWRPRVEAVKDITFSIKKGEVFGLLGPNGSGKSTTIKMLLGLLNPTQGSLSVLGHSPRHTRTKQRIGFLPEESYLYPYLTAEETLLFFGKLFGYSGRPLQEKVERLLARVDLTRHRHRQVGEFSKGMARRVGLAQALINDPELVILDEPTSGLDPIGTRQVKDLILELAEHGSTILLSSHLLADVEDVCERIAILYNGSLRASGPVSELLELKQQARLTFDAPAPDRLEMAKHAVERETGSAVVVDHPRRNLEKYFLEIIEQARKDKS